MALLILGLILFIGIHLLPVFSSTGASVKSRLGPGGYKGLFFLVSLAGLILMVIGYGNARSDGPLVLYEPPLFLRHVVLLLMLPVFVLFLASGAPGYIKKTVKHPQILAIKIWAFSHLLANGDLPSVILFGSFLAWGVIGRISMKRRDRVRAGSGIVDGQAKVSADVIAIVVGLAIYALFVWKVHAWLIGVPIV